MPAAVTAGNPAPLYEAPSAASHGPTLSGADPVNMAQVIADARARFEAGLQSQRLDISAVPGLPRDEFAQRRALPLLWNLQDALLNLQQAKNADGRFSADISIDSRAGRDASLAIATLGGYGGGAAGRLDQVTRPQDVQQFDLAILR